MIEEMNILMRDQERIAAEVESELFRVQTNEDFEDADMLGTLG